MDVFVNKIYNCFIGCLVILRCILHPKQCMYVRRASLLKFNSPTGMTLLFKTSLINSCTICSKFLVQVTGSFWIRFDFCCQLMVLSLSSVSSFFSTSLPRILNRCVHLVSAAENVQKHVGLPKLGNHSKQMFSAFFKIWW